jgi:hypothetical protein
VKRATAVCTNIDNLNRKKKNSHIIKKWIPTKTHKVLSSIHRQNPTNQGTTKGTVSILLPGDIRKLSYNEK